MRRNTRRATAGRRAGGASPWALSEAGVMTVPPWEFFPQVFPELTFAEGASDSARLRSIAGGIGWRQWSSAGDATAVVYALDVGGDAAKDGVAPASAISTAVTAIIVMAETGYLGWDGSAVLMTLPEGAQNQTS